MTRAPWSSSVADHRQGGPDAAVVGDPARLVQRHVQVAAKQDAPALDSDLDQVVKRAHRVRATSRPA